MSFKLREVFSEEYLLVLKDKGAVNSVKSPELDKTIVSDISAQMKMNVQSWHWELCMKLKSFYMSITGLEWITATACLPNEDLQNELCMLPLGPSTHPIKFPALV